MTLFDQGLDDILVVAVAADLPQECAGVPPHSSTVERRLYSSKCWKKTMQEDSGAASSLGSLEVLSEEVILLIFSFVPPADLLAKSVGSVCKTFHRLVGDQQLYATLFDGN